MAISPSSLTSCQLSVQATQEGLGQIRLHTRAHAWNCLLTLAVAPTSMALLQRVPILGACVWSRECRAC